MSIVCPKCHMESHNPNDSKYGWCDNCQQFHSAVLKKEPIYFDAVVERLLYAVKKQIVGGTPFSLQFEIYEDHGHMWWRALIKMGQGVWKSTRLPQESPGDALRELSEMVDAGL